MNLVHLIRRSRALAVLGLVALLLSCTEDSARPGATGATDVPDVQGAHADAADAGTGLGGFDVPALPDVAFEPDTPDTGSACTEVGGLLCPCSDNKECGSGYCVETGNGMVCTAVCIEDCPEGYACRLLSQSGADATFLCLPQFPHLCDPCVSDSDCVGYFGSGNRCIPHGTDGTAGSFCGVTCKASIDCPKGYACEEVVEGAQPQCVPESGECVCSSSATDSGLETGCSITNDEGTCSGVRRCDSIGLTECTAPDPAPEECNGTDDDCDGQVDEDIAQVECTPEEEGPCPASTVCEKGKTVCRAGEPEAELCDGKDNDCDGETDEEGAFGCKTFFSDMDADHYGNASDTRCLCEAMIGYDANQAGDCEDDDPSVYPGSLESCNGKDDNCNGEIDPESSDGCTVFFRDADGDGSGILGDAQCLCAPKPPYTATEGGDCNDTNPSIKPLAIEKCNGQDDDCNGIVDDENAKGCLVYLTDADLDGTGKDDVGTCLCSPKYPSTALKGGDCDDTDVMVNPEAIEKCNATDDDCDGTIDEEGSLGCSLLVKDVDGDGYGIGGDAKCLCDPAPPYSAAAVGDCNDASPVIYPGAPEVCNGTDDNCNGLVDEAGAVGCQAYTVDSDKDGFGADDTDKCLCGPSGANSALLAGDCDDKNPQVNPNAEELCNVLDDDCDGVVDDPGATGCKVFMADMDEDGYGTGTNVSCLCVAAKPYTATVGGDCDDQDPGAKPGVEEVCNGKDDDCDGQVDEGAAKGCIPYYMDADGDGHGTSEETCACGPAEPFGAEVDGDCDDADPDVFPGARELCDGIDQDCDGVLDGNYSCAAGAVEMQSEPCGSCGTRTRERACLDVCIQGQWSPWSECIGEGVCIGGTLETQQETVPCGSCGGQLRQRTRGCTASCQFQEWSPWIEIGTCSGEGACQPGDEDEEIRVVACGLCGGQEQRRSRMCGVSCGWTAWSQWANVGECTGSGACSAGTVENESLVEPCGSCGGQQKARSRTCSTSCLWDPWSPWTNVGTCAGEGICPAGEVEVDTRAVSCGFCGFQQQERTRLCSGTCGWGAWSPWKDVGVCEGAGECIPGYSELDATIDVCGNCGSQGKQRNRSCSSSCMWEPWDEWTNIGTCQAAGVCSTGAVEKETDVIPCGNCGTLSRERTRTCDAGCAWDAWSEWKETSSCLGSGTCAPGEADKQQSEVPCGNCGMQPQERTRTCSSMCGWQEWSPWTNVGTCGGAGPCAPGANETDWSTIECGYCGSQQQSRMRTCTQACGWAEWGAYQNVGGCTGSGACGAGQTDTELQTVACGDCGTKQQSRTRSCADACFWESWTAWKDDTACTGEGACSPGLLEDQEQWVPCGMCGQQKQTRSRACSSGCGWGAWTPWQNEGTCTGEGVCEVGAAETQEQWVPCGTCGQQKETRTRACGTTCGWGAWTAWQPVGLCTGVGICEAGATETKSQVVPCGYCGTVTQTSTRSCSGACGWSDWSAWQDSGSCSGQGACSAGTTDTETQYVSCGTCGLQQQTRSRTCSSSCGWGSFSPWQNVGLCSGQGACSPGAQDSQGQWVGCGNCGQQQQTRYRSCDSTCSWASWGSWQNNGSCLNQGSCSAGQSETQYQNVACGNCGTQQQVRTRYCSSSCGWGAWSGWSNVGGCSGQGTCSSGASETQTQYVNCGLCGSQKQIRSRTCNSSCGWGSWSSWQNSGSCSGQGVCSPGAKQWNYQILACSGCSSREQEQSRTCTSSCSWGSYSSWSNVYPCPSSCYCSWQSGTNWRCCGHHKWQYCLSAGKWSSACASFNDSWNQCP